MCVMFYSSFVCISAYAKQYYGSPSSWATSGFPQYCVSTCVRFGCTGHTSLWIPTQKKSQGHKWMDDDDMQSVHEAARIVEQHPAHCVSVCVCVCVYVCFTLTSYMIFLCIHTVIQGGQGYLEVIED